MTAADVDAYENALGQPMAWAYFSHNWYRDRHFPLATASWIRDRCATPFIRLMVRFCPWRPRAERTFRLQNILAGEFDTDLRQWAREARDFGWPLTVEYGTECNGKWFPRNGRWNGGARRSRFGDPGKADGPERFVAAFRHIVTLMRSEGALNITWVFHVNWNDWPPRDWNRMGNYYPGDDVVDGVAVSAYGPQTLDREANSFRDEGDSAYARVQAMAAGKPVIVAKFGAAAGNPLIVAQAWAAPALEDLLAWRWPDVVGFSWWNERWQNDNNPSHDTTMRRQDIPALADVFPARLQSASTVLQTTPVFVNP